MTVHVDGFVMIMVNSKISSVTPAYDLTSHRASMPVMFLARGPRLHEKPHLVCERAQVSRDLALCQMLRYYSQSLSATRKCITTRNCTPSERPLALLCYSSILSLVSHACAAGHAYVHTCMIKV